MTADGLAISFAPPSWLRLPDRSDGAARRAEPDEALDRGQPSPVRREETNVAYPTSAGWVGNVYTRAGYPG